MTLRDHIKFLWHFLSHPRLVAALMPSSKSLGLELMRAARVDEADFIIELGTGPGNISEAILDMKGPRAGYMGIEINESLALSAQERLPGADIVWGSAARMQAILSLRQRDSCDAVVSCLPWVTVEDATQDEILDQIYDTLSPGGHFSTLALLPGALLPKAEMFRKKMAERFGNVQVTRVVWANLPPAVVYWSVKDCDPR
jgi:phosphatidylethanolamine/phosphatidyl-N-methylethanolamine N-methyltransferase